MVERPIEHAVLPEAELRSLPYRVSRFVSNGLTETIGEFRRLESAVVFASQERWRAVVTNTQGKPIYNNHRDIKPGGIR